MLSSILKSKLRRTFSKVYILEREWNEYNDEKNSRLSKSRQFILLEIVFFLHTGIIGAVYTLYLLSILM